MKRLVVQAFWKLVHFDLLLARGDFANFCDQVRRCEVKRSIETAPAPAEICAAVDMACIWYWKEVLCFQRSAATVCLLRRYGLPAQLIIGAQHMPFKAHAWAELEGCVINDRPYIREMYAALDSI